MNTNEIGAGEMKTRLSRLDGFRGLGGLGGGGVLAAATVVTGLVAGVYYAFACSVMLGLGASGDRTFIEAMQNINRKIENPVFFLAFFGALVLPAWALRTFRHDRRLRLWIAAGLALYAIGLLTTMAVNVPLNDRLAAAGAPAGIADLAAVRARFEDTWNAWNITRAVLSTGAAVCLSRALLMARPAQITAAAHAASSAKSSAVRPTAGSIRRSSAGPS